MIALIRTYAVQAVAVALSLIVCVLLLKWRDAAHDRDFFLSELTKCRQETAALDASIRLQNNSIEELERAGKTAQDKAKALNASLAASRKQLAERIAQLQTAKGSSCQDAAPLFRESLKAIR